MSVTDADVSFVGVVPEVDQSAASVTLARRAKRALDVTLALLVLALLPIITIMFVAIGGRMQRIFRSVQDKFGDLSTRAQENFSGIRTIKAYAQEEAEVRVFHEENERYRAMNVRYVLLSGALWPTISVVMGVIAAITLFFGGRFVAQGVMTLGDLVLFNTYLALLSWPMINLGWTVNLYQQASALSNYPFAAAIGLTFLVAVLLCVSAFNALGRVSRGYAAA